MGYRVGRSASLNIGRGVQFCTLCGIVCAFLVSCGLLVFSIYLYLDDRRNFLLYLVPAHLGFPWFRIVCFIFFACGLIGFLISVLALFGCACKTACSLFTFGYLSILVSVCSLGSLALVVAHQYYIGSAAYAVQFNKMVVHDYGRIHMESVVDLVDRVQFFLQCCGSRNGSYDYFTSYYSIEKSIGARHYVPASCCTQSRQAWAPHDLQPVDSEACVFRPSAPATARYSKPCLPELRNFASFHFQLALVVGCASALVFLIAAACAFRLCCRIHHARARQYMKSKVDYQEMQQLGDYNYRAAVM